MIKLKYSINTPNVSKFSKFNKNKKPSKPVVWINFENVIDDEANDMRDKVWMTLKYGARKNGDAVSYSTSDPMDESNPSTQQLINGYNYLASTNRYEMPPLKYMLMQMEDMLKNRATPEEIEAVEKSTDDMYVEFMQKLQDPKIQTLLKSLGQYQVATTRYGWKKSMDNVMRALAQNPNATFVQTAPEWFHKYNRNIKLGAKKILLATPVQDYKKIPYDDILDAMRDARYDSSVRFEDLSTQQRDYITVMAVYHSGHGFEMKPYFDVSDTYVIEGEEDIWSNEVGFDNNFTMHLNQIAMDDVTAQGIELDGFDPREIYNNEEGNPKLLNHTLVKGIQRKYPEVKAVEGSESLSSFIKNVRNLANYLLETKSKLVRQENRELGINIITAFVLAFTKLKPEYVCTQYNDKVMERNAYLELRDRINDIIRLINDSMLKMENKNNINESIPYLQSVDQMLEMMGLNLNDEQQAPMECKENDKETIKENFMKTLNRLNEHKYYNEKFN